MRRIYSAIIIVAILAACLNLLKPAFAASGEKPAPVPVPADASNGFVFSLTLDKDTYAVNSDITLHISCSRVTADWKQSGGSHYLKPCEPDVKLTDGKGAPVEFRPCFGVEDSGPFATLNIEQGAIVPGDIILNKACPTSNEKGTEAVFPDLPGTYTVTAVWEAHSEGPEVKATLRSKPVTFHIAGN
jgi:hypothetical protein